MKIASVALVAAAVFVGTAAQAEDLTVKIGVMSDMSGLYADLGGPGSVAAAKLAIEDFNPAAHGMKVEIVTGDMQNKPDVGSNLARQWFDVDHVDMIVDVPNSGVALAVNEVAREKNKVFLVSGAASSDLTGPKCSPDTIHWTYDTWMLANGTGKALVKTGGDTWFFLTADYAFGHALERDTTAVVARQWRQGRGQRQPSAEHQPTSRRSCCRRRRRRQRSSALPMPAAIRSTRSSRAPNSASPRAASNSPVCWCSSATSIRSG